MLRVAPARLTAFAAAAAVLGSVFVSDNGRASDAATFMESFSGEWHGAGRLLVGPETGKYFHCRLNGKPSRTQLTFKMNGKCWMGRLGAKVHATLRYSSEQGKFFGTFMDGASGDGVDVIGERIGDGSGFVLRLQKEMAKGLLVVEPLETGVLEATLSLLDTDNKRDIPIAAMGFGRPEQVGLNTDPGISEPAIKTSAKTD